MMVFRGDMEPPEFEHGEVVQAHCFVGVIQHRRHNGRVWEYGLLSDACPCIIWTSFPQRIQGTKNVSD